MKAPESSYDIRLASKVAARTAHDLNNVAAVFSGHLFLLRNSAESTEEAFESMEKAIEHLQRLTLSLSILGGLGVEEVEAFDLNEITRAAAADPVHRGCSIELDLDLSLPRLSGRKNEVRQAFDSLLSNAREAGGAAQVILISTRHLPQAHAAVLAIEDSGKGIPPEIRERVFEPLFSTKGEKGRGIGLTLAGAVAALHGGSCEIEDRPGGGARAVLCLPVKHH